MAKVLKTAHEDWIEANKQKARVLTEDRDWFATHSKHPDYDSGKHITMRVAHGMTHSTITVIMPGGDTNHAQAINYNQEVSSFTSEFVEAYDRLYELSYNLGGEVFQIPEVTQANRLLAQRVQSAYEEKFAHKKGSFLLLMFPAGISARTSEGKQRLYRYAEPLFPKRMKKFCETFKIKLEIDK